MSISRTRGWLRASSCSSLSALLLLPPGAFAQSTTEISQLDTVTVTADREATPSLLKGSQTLRETPQSVTIITRERMDQQNLQSLDEVLQHAPGITVQPYQLLTTGYYARGFKIDSFQQDGVPIQMGQMASPPQDAGIYERVEILRGANGLMQGSGNPAATVNLVPKRAPREFLANGELSAGSWNRYRGLLDVGGPLNESGSLRARIVANHEDRDFFYDVAGQKTSSVYGTADLDLGPDTVLTVGLQRQRIRSTTNMAGVPFYKDGSDIGLPRSTYLDVDWDRFDWDTTRVFGGIEHAFGNAWTAKLSVNYQNGDSTLKYAGANGAVDPATGAGPRLTGGAYKFENDQKSIDGYLNGPFHLLGRRHEATLGWNYQRTSLEQFSASFLTPVNQPVNVWDWDPGSVPEPGIGPYASRGPTRTTQSGLYAVGRFSLADPLTLITGVRLSRWKQEGAATSTKLGNELTPYGGVVLDIAPQWSLYASYAQIFQPQTQTTWDGKTLDPVKGTNLEAGIKGELLDGKLNTSLAFFNIRQRNRAQVDPAYPCAGTACFYISGGEVESQGVEAEISGRPLPGLDLSFGYTYNTTKYLKDAQSQGQAFASFTPRHIARLWANYAFPWDGGRLSAGMGVQAQSAYTVQSGGLTLRQGGYALVSARLGYRINRNLSAALHLNNLFDRRYYQSLFGPQWNNRYGEPRSVMLTLRAQY
ncbi:TonB-dependent siderophore receptor [Pseudomonas aeruginosa]|uniref:TonB-dependent siderophore receptor n=1 Tax=Pseudomonas aeruginosa TaxID=287 RepID=UPI001CF3E706|nr:TonB-dependent siderophore receptor [Pseudomonas aeruginosa]MBY9653803.1 TonB-dependent siderophore receptor [Pseudomonas aeruginosa]MBY9793006.1 TonB-dependent siderophore receptor [Pseudomonas aeruginosa]MCA6860619.1 TonB-dependent siderophore receptor [Pseudomonas aeruginosa]